MGKVAQPNIGPVAVYHDKVQLQMQWQITGGSVTAGSKQAIKAKEGGKPNILSKLSHVAHPPCQFVQHAKHTVEFGKAIGMFNAKQQGKWSHTQRVP